VYREGESRESRGHGAPCPYREGSPERAGL
jgi:hypothetical protein